MCTFTFLGLNFCFGGFSGKRGDQIGTRICDKALFMCATSRLLQSGNCKNGRCVLTDNVCKLGLGPLFPVLREKILIRVMAKRFCTTALRSFLISFAISSVIRLQTEVEQRCRWILGVMFGRLRPGVDVGERLWLWNVRWEGERSAESTVSCLVVYRLKYGPLFCLEIGNPLSALDIIFHLYWAM